AEVRQKTPLGLDIGVADLVAHLGGLAGQFAALRHRKTSNYGARAWRARAVKFSIARARERIGDRGLSRQAKAVGPIIERAHSRPTPCLRNLLLSPHLRAFCLVCPHGLCYAPPRNESRVPA